MDLLHERLLQKNEDGLCALVYVNSNEEDSIQFLCSWEAEGISEEIQRDYMVRPRDNDGVPYHKGDKVWSIDPDTEYSAIVTSVAESYIELKWEDDSHSLADPCDMTHKIPESIDTIINDMIGFRNRHTAPGIPEYDYIGDWITRLENLKDSGHC